MRLIATKEKVQIKWFVWAGGEMFPKESSMISYVGYDFECSCGYKSHTGGAIKAYIKGEIDHHKISEHDYEWTK